MLTVRKIVYQSRNILILASLSTHIAVHRIPAKSVCVCHKRKTFQTLQRNMSITFNKAANCVQRSTHVTDEWKMNLIALCWVSTFLKWVRICIADQKHIQSAGRVTFLGLGACWQRFYDSNSSKNVELWPPHKLTHISINLKSIFIWMANILCANQSVLKGGLWIDVRFKLGFQLRAKVKVGFPVLCRRNRKEQHNEKCLVIYCLNVWQHVDSQMPK